MFHSEILVGFVLSLNVAAEEVPQDIFQLFEDVWEYHPHPQHQFDPPPPQQMN